MTPPPFPFEIVAWVDSAGDAGWRSLPPRRPAAVVPCQTAGWLVEETDEVVRLAASYAPETETNDEQVCGDMTIPKVAIVSRRRVSLSPKKGTA